MAVSKKFDLEKYLDLIKEIKADMQIEPSGQSNETARRRITVACVDAYLSAGGNTREAYFFEASLFSATHEQALSCGGLLPEEIRLKSIGRFGQDTSDCLKLLSEGCSLIPRMSLTQKTMEVLLNETRRDPPARKGKERGRVKKAKDAGTRKAHTRESPDRRTRDIKMGSRKASGKGPSLYRGSKGEKDLS